MVIRRSLCVLACSPLIFCASCTSCITVVPPDIHITGERTAFERQITGEYQELEKDAWIVSSARTSVKQITRVSVDGDSEADAAVKIREFHAPRIRRYKDSGVLEENSRGLIEIRERKKISGDDENKEISLLIKEENRARRILFSRSLDTKSESGRAVEEKTDEGREFARQQALSAHKGDWLQNDRGVWYKKR